MQNFTVKYFNYTLGILIVCACKPLFLSLSKVFTILPFTSGESTLLDCTLKGANLEVWARSLVRIMTLACGAGDPGFKSQRAHYHFSINS